jgi:hypothetical protein
LDTLQQKQVLFVLQSLSTQTRNLKTGIFVTFNLLPLARLFLNELFPSMVRRHIIIIVILISLSRVYFLRLELWFFVLRLILILKPVRILPCQHGSSLFIILLNRIGCGLEEGDIFTKNARLATV